MLKNQEFIRSENYLVNSSEHHSALNFMLFATELKLLIFKISARTFLKNLSFRKELSCSLRFINTCITIICEQKEIQSLDFLASLLLRGDS
jgi:hypothetical protein